MIPKVIHYCWFGGNPKPELIQKCIASWRKYCPDYQIIEWNENNFDINSIPYTAAAYADKKWAFVSDYARLKIVFQLGGIYLDTDVLLHHCLDELLEYECWLASDDVRYINTGLGFGATPGHPLIKAVKDAYTTYQYPEGTNVIRDSKIIETQLKYWKKSDRNQVIDDLLIIGLKDYGKYARHLYTYTWSDEKTQKKREEEIKSGSNVTWCSKLLWKIKCLARSPEIIAYFDTKRGSRIEKLYTFLAYDFLDCGPIYFFKRLIRKIFR